MKLFGKLFGEKKVVRKRRKKAVPKEEEKANILNLGLYRSERKREPQLAKIREKDRRTHFYVVGASGAGKSKFMEFLIRQDVEKENGFGIIDPHGDLVGDVKAYLASTLSAKDLEEKIILIEPANERFTVAFNPLEKVEGVSSAEIATELVEAFKKIWFEAWGARMEDLLRNSFIALVEAEKTLADLPQFLTDEDFRLGVLEKVSHPVAREYFKRFNALSPRTRAEWMESTLNKVDAFLVDDRIREMLSFNHSSFSLRKVIDQKRILLLNLDKGKLGDNADLVGSLFLTKIRMAAFSRSDLPKEKRIPWYLYIDEFQNFATKSFIDTLSEARKYGLSLIMAHQNLSQLPKSLQDSILTNCGIQICFRVSRRDAEIMAKEFFEVTDEVREAKLRSSPLETERVDYDYYTVQEEWEKNFQELQHLSDRQFYARHKLEGGCLLLKSADVLSQAYERENYEVLGKNYLRERARKVEKPKEEKKEKLTTLEEITATLSPIEKAVLWAIGTGNYHSADIFEQANRKLKEMGGSTRQYSEFKRKFYELSKLPPQGKGLIEFMRRGRGFCYWLSQWGEISFAEKFDMPSDRAINELGGGGKLSKAIALEIIRGWLEPQGYSVRKEEELKTYVNLSKRGYTDLVATKGNESLRIEIEHRSPKEQVEKNIRKNLEYSDTLYIIASDRASRSKATQVALKTIFRLKKRKPQKDLKVKIASIDELKRSGFKNWFDINTRD